MGRRSPTRRGSMGSRRPKLARKQQRAMFAKANALAMQHQKLVHSVVAKTVRRFPALKPHHEDLAQAGMVGLIQHARRYNPKKGAFSTLGEVRIRKHVLREGKKHLSSVTVGERKISELKRTGSLPKNVPLTSKKARATLLTKATSGGLSSATAKMDVAKLMKTLSARERQVVSLRFLDEHPVKTVAKRMKITPGRVKKIQLAAMKKLKTHAMKEAA